MEINEEVVKRWVTRLEEWQKVDAASNCILEMTEGMEELMNLLSELEKSLTNLEPRQILFQLPSVPKLLQALLNNIMVQTTESLYHLVMRCVTAVAVSNQGQNEDGITSKSVKWVKSQIKNVCTSTPPVVNSLVGVGESLGLQPLELTEKLNNELVMSLVKELSDVPSREWNNTTGDFFPKCPIQGTTLRNISEMCLTIISKKVVQPLIEALLTCHVANDIMTKSHLDSESAVQVEEALSSHFLDAVKVPPKDCYLGTSKGIPLSYEARLGLWLRDSTYFEDEVFCLLEICCKKRAFMSRNEMRKVVSMRDVPKALSDNISLFCFTFGILQRVIHQTNGNYHVMKFVGILLDCVNKSLLQNKLCDPFYNYNYAIVWGAELSDLVNLLNINWNELPAEALLHHLNTVAQYIHEKLQSRIENTVSYTSYYVWLILQGFPELMEKCYWIILVGTEELCYHGGGTMLSENVKGKFRDFVSTLRLLKNKNLITTSDILCAIDFIFHIDILQKEISIRNLTKKLVMVFIFLISSTQNLNLQDIFHKFTEQLPAHYVLDFLLDCLEEAFSFQDNSELQWPHEERYLKKTSAFIRLLCDTHTKWKEFVNHPTNLTSEMTQCNTTDLSTRFQTVCKLLDKEVE